LNWYSNLNHLINRVKIIGKPFSLAWAGSQPTGRFLLSAHVWPTNKPPTRRSFLSLSLDAPPWKAGRAAMAAGSGWRPHVVEPIRLCALPTTLYKSRRGCLPQNPSQLGISLPNPPLVTSRREKWGSRRWGRLSGRVTARREDRSRRGKEPYLSPPRTPTFATLLLRACTASSSLHRHLHSWAP
jgi:hypothetical protein